MTEMTALNHKTVNFKCAKPVRNNHFMAVYYFKNFFWEFNLGH